LFLYLALIFDLRGFICLSSYIISNYGNSTWNCSISFIVVAGKQNWNKFLLLSHYDLWRNSSRFVTVMRINSVKKRCQVIIWNSSCAILKTSINFSFYILAFALQFWCCHTVIQSDFVFNIAKANGDCSNIILKRLIIVQFQGCCFCTQLIFKFFFSFVSSCKDNRLVFPKHSGWLKKNSFFTMRFLRKYTGTNYTMVPISEESWVISTL
jgi:hypothetical protein